MQLAAFFFPESFSLCMFPANITLVCISGVLLDEGKKNVFNGTVGCVILQAFS